MCVGGGGVAAASDEGRMRKCEYRRARCDLYRIFSSKFFPPTPLPTKPLPTEPNTITIHIHIPTQTILYVREPAQTRMENGRILDYFFGIYEIRQRWGRGGGAKKRDLRLSYFLLLPSSLSSSSFFPRTSHLVKNILISRNVTFCAKVTPPPPPVNLHVCKGDEEVRAIFYGFSRM